MEKYAFYNEMGRIKTQVCDSVPDGKGVQVCEIIDRKILDKKSFGLDRNWKKIELWKVKDIVDNFVATEGDGFAIGEYLTDYERYYRGHGVPLTMPDDGLLDFANERENGGQG